MQAARVPLHTATTSSLQAALAHAEQKAASVFSELSSAPGPGWEPEQPSAKDTKKSVKSNRFMAGAPVDTIPLIAWHGRNDK